MSKADRRKRARARAKERDKAAVGAQVASADGGESGVASLSVAASFAEPEPAVAQAATPTHSAFITGPVAPRVPGPVRTVRELPVGPRPVAQPSASEVEGDEESEDDEGAEDEDADDDEDQDDDDDEDGEEMDEQDALFNLACAAVEEGDQLTWNELVTWMLAAEVEDPRLATVTALLATEDDTSEVPKLTGQRVLEVLEAIGLGEMVTEARDTVAAAPKEDETEEERVIVRDTARQLAQQAKRELGKPVKASDLRAAKAERSVKR